jgi:hypothetical protein
MLHEILKLFNPPWENWMKGKENMRIQVQSISNQGLQRKKIPKQGNTASRSGVLYGLNRFGECGFRC